ncbi:MAG: aminotransferase class III-fold pyridoxal phosphate-dependent enzyme [Acidimicrobiia bacterium]
MSDLLSRHEDLIAPVIAFDTDLVIERAEGLWIHDAAGNRWADFACGTAVANLGHNHPAVVAAAHAQIDKVMHSGCVFRYEPLVEAAERLREITPDGIEKFGFANSGSEAVEAAVKLARKTAGRQAVIAFRGGFHGRTMGSVAYTTSNSKYRDGYHPILGSTFISPFPHPYRWGMTEDEAVSHSLNELEMLFRHEVAPHNVAAMLIEPVQGEGGYYPAPVSFMSELRRICDEHGILLVFDEVQTGFGRTAEWFASEHFPVNPDIIAMGKGIANGLPLSAYGASTEMIDGWKVGSHGTTFGGNPVSCAASVAVMDTMGAFLPNARTVSARAFDEFEKLKIEHPTIGDVRGLGLMIGVELVTDRDTREPDAAAFAFIQDHCLQRELVVIECGPTANIIRFIPPVITTVDEVDWAIGLIDDALTRYEA